MFPTRIDESARCASLARKRCLEETPTRWLGFSWELLHARAAVLYGRHCRWQQLYGLCRLVLWRELEQEAPWGDVPGEDG
jgi:hypothetical protein